jgi:hypothetical protein
VRNDPFADTLASVRPHVDDVLAVGARMSSKRLQESGGVAPRGEGETYFDTAKSGRK